MSNNETQSPAVMTRLGFPLGDLGMWLSKTPVTTTKGAGSSVVELMTEVNDMFKANPDMWLDGLQVTGGLNSAQVGVLFHAGIPYLNSIPMAHAYLWLSTLDTYRAAKDSGDEPMAMLEREVARLFHENPDARIATWQLTGGRGSAMLAILSYTEVQP